MLTFNAKSDVSFEGVGRHGSIGVVLCPGLHGLCMVPVPNGPDA